MTGRPGTYATATRALLELRLGLIDQQVTIVGVEATGDYWKPAYYLLEDAVEVQLLNAAHMHNVPGSKTYGCDSAWIARLVEHSLVRASFVPPPIRRRRDLTRYREALTAERTRGEQRMQKLLEDAGIRLSVLRVEPVRRGTVIIGDVAYGDAPVHAVTGSRAPSSDGPIGRVHPGTSARDVWGGTSASRR